VLLHEFAHALVAQRRGLPVPRITLFVFGGVSHMGRQPSSAREELAIAIAGPLTSFATAVLCGLIAFVTGGIEKVQAVFGYLATVNVLLGVFNLVPGFPLDGGRVLRAIAWERTGSLARATRVAATVGEYVAYGMMAIGAFMLLSGLPTNGLWLILIAWFLLSASRAEAGSVRVESVLGRLRARDVMDESYGTVDRSEPLADVIQSQMFGHGHRAVVVTDDGRFAGIATVTDARGLERDTWANTPVGSAMTPGAKVVSVGPDAPAIDVLQLLAEKRLNQVPVLSDGRVLGLVSRRELVERLGIAESLQSS
jgi:Zn-dependent protease/predicted transcriptional regulator